MTKRQFSIYVAFFLFFPNKKFIISDCRTRDSVFDANDAGNQFSNHFHISCAVKIPLINDTIEIKTRYRWDFNKVDCKKFTKLTSQRTVKTGRIKNVKRMLRIARLKLYNATEQSVRKCKINVNTKIGISKKVSRQIKKVRRFEKIYKRSKDFTHKNHLKMRE